LGLCAVRCRAAGLNDRRDLRPAVRDVLAGNQNIRALEIFAIYVTPFLILGFALRFLMKRYAVDLPDVEKQVGPKPKRRFLLGAWRNED
jgi:hypothetical protein